MGIVLKKTGNDTNKIHTRGFEPQISMNWKHPSMQNYQGTHQKKTSGFNFCMVFSQQSLFKSFKTPMDSTWGCDP
jgi:hypothetical protein